MNKSPDPKSADRPRPDAFDEQAFADLAAESRIQSNERLTAHPELLADRALRDELAGLEPPALPSALRARVLNHSRRRRAPAGWMALAAAVVLSVVLVIALDREPSAPNGGPNGIAASDWMQLEIALNTLDASGRRMAQVTGQEVIPHLPRSSSWLDIRLPRIPTLERLLQRFEPTLQPER
jgi:hypothetical protein